MNSDNTLIGTNGAGRLDGKTGNEIGQQRVLQQWRRSDMVHIEGEIFINRPLEEVFDVVADERNEPRYNPLG